MRLNVRASGLETTCYNFTRANLLPYKGMIWQLVEWITYLYNKTGG